MKLYRIGGIVGLTGRGMTGNPGAVRDVWANSAEHAQVTYASSVPGARDPYSYPVLEHRKEGCPACDKLFCDYLAWG